MQPVTELVWDAQAWENWIAYILPAQPAPTNGPYLVATHGAMVHALPATTNELMQQAQEEEEEVIVEEVDDLDDMPVLLEEGVEAGPVPAPTNGLVEQPPEEWEDVIEEVEDEIDQLNFQQWHLQPQPHQPIVAPNTAPTNAEVEDLDDVPELDVNFEAALHAQQAGVVQNVEG